MEKFPLTLVTAYIKTCHRLKKIETSIFKRSNLNVSAILNEFMQLTAHFDDSDLHQYAAMCQIGVAKCESYLKNPLGESCALIKCARYFLKAYEATKSLFLSLNFISYREAAIACLDEAAVKCPDVTVTKAAIIREITSLKPDYENTSAFNSPTHRIYELEQSVELCIMEKDFWKALQQVDDIVDNIYERKKQELYGDLLGRMEIYRILLLVVLSLPLIRLTPAHIKLISYYVQLTLFSTDRIVESTLHVYDQFGCAHNWQPGQNLPIEQMHDLADIIYYWHWQTPVITKIFVKDFLRKYSSITVAQKHLLDTINNKIETF